MNTLSQFKRNSGKALLSMALASVSAYGNASVFYSGPQQTYGGVNHGQGLISINNNPASAAYSHSLGNERQTSGSFSIAAGIEYGDMDDLFDLIDESSASLQPSDGSTAPNNDPPEFNIDIDNPDFSQLVSEMELPIGRLTAALALISTEGYAKAYAQVDLPWIVGSEVWGGTLAFSFTSHLKTSALGVAEPINFDSDVAKAELEAAYQLTSSSPVTTYDLSGGLFVTIDPADRSVSYQFENDSMLLSRSASYNEFAASYGRSITLSDDHALFIGVEPKLIYAGLSQVGLRMGDITDSEDVFDDIRGADKNFDEQFSLDLGAVWRFSTFHIGLAGTNLIEPEFRFPSIDLSEFTDPEIIAFIESKTNVTLKNQWTFEGGWLSENRRWALNGSYDVNSTKDILGDSYQWAAASLGYWGDSWWFPAFRAGYRENMAGTKLRYYSAGMSMFKFVNLDLAFSPDSVDIDGEGLPRGFAISLGTSFTF